MQTNIYYFDSSSLTFQYTKISLDGSINVHEFKLYHGNIIVLNENDPWTITIRDTNLELVKIIIPFSIRNKFKPIYYKGGQEKNDTFKKIKSVIQNSLSNKYLLLPSDTLLEGLKDKMVFCNTVFTNFYKLYELKSQKIYYPDIHIGNVDYLVEDTLEGIYSYLKDA